MSETKRVLDTLAEAETNLQVRATTACNKWFMLQLKFTAPRDSFRHFEALTVFGGFPSLEDYVRENFHKLIDDYCSEAAARLRQAAQPDFLPPKRRAANS